MTDNFRQHDNGLAGFVVGLRSPLAGCAFLWRHRRLWAYGVWPIVVSLAITLVVGTLALAGTTWLLFRLPDWIPAGDRQTVWIVVAGVGVVAAAAGITLAVWLVALAVLCGLWYGRLAEQVELQLGADPKSLREVPWRQQVVDAVVDVSVLLAVNAGCLALNLIPVLGTIAGATIGLYVDCFFLGREFLDYSLALHGLRRSERLAIARRFRATTLGLGAATLLLTLIPLAGPVLLVAAVTGAVLLRRECRMLATKLDDIPPQERQRNSP